MFFNLLISVEVVAICPLLGSEALLTSFIMMFSNAMIAILVKSSSTFSPASNEKSDELSSTHTPTWSLQPVYRKPPTSP